MNLGIGNGSMSTVTSSAAMKSIVAVSDQFPAGLRVLVVDDDPTCLMILEKKLRKCLYKVTKCRRAETALSLLRDNKNGFDIVISNVHMRGMDGFKLLEHIELEMDLPVIIFSADDDQNVVMKGVALGACDYLIKPANMEVLKNIWQHVVRKRKNEQKHTDYSSTSNEANCRKSENRRDKEEEAEERGDTSTSRKPRLVWSFELHQLFVAVVDQLGIDKAVPKKILELMNVHWLTRENVASHIQKYRLYLQRQSEVSMHQSNSNSFLRPQAAVPMPLMDQRNLFSFESPRLGFGGGQQQHLGSSKPMNLLHEIPTNMELIQLANSHQSTQSLGNINMQVNACATQSKPLLQLMTQSQPRGQMLSENTSPRVRLSTSLGQPNVSNGIFNSLLGRNGIACSNRSPAHNFVPQISSSLSFPMNQTTEMSVGSFPHGVTPGICSITKKGLFQEEGTSGMKGPGGFPSYDILNELHHQKSRDLDTTNPCLTYVASQHENLQGNIDVSPSVSVQHGFSSSQKTGQSRDAPLIGKNMLSLGECLKHDNLQNASQHLNKLLDDDSIRVKAERNLDAISQTNLKIEQEDECTSETARRPN